MSSKPQSDPKSNPATAPEGKKKKGGKKGKKGRRKKSPNNISMAVEIPVPKCTCFDAFMDSETKKCPKNGAESMGNMCVTHCAIDDEMDAETKQCNMQCLKEMKCLLKRCKAKCPPCSDDPKQQEKRKECIECCKEAVECRMKMCKANCTKCSPKYNLRKIPSACSNNSSCSDDGQRKKCLNEEDDYDTKKNREREKEDKNEEISQLCDELRTTLTCLIEDQKQVEKGLKIIRQQQTQYGEPNSQVTQDILRKNTQLVLEAEARCEEHRDQLMSSLQNFKCMMEGDNCKCPSEMEIDSVQIDKLVKILGDYDKKGLGVRLFCFYLYLLIYNIDVL